MAVVYHRGSPSDRPSGTRRPTPGRLTACPREATLGKAPLPALRRRRRLRLCSRRPATGTVPPPHRWTAAREVEGLDIDAYRFCVIGPGRLGSTLLAGLLEAGLTVAAVGVHADDDTDLRMIPRHVLVADAALEADAWWLTVPDDEIYTVAARLAASLPATRRGGRPPLAVHSSGLGSIHLLKPLFEQGVRVLCLHPLQTVAGERRAELLRGAPGGVAARGPSRSSSARGSPVNVCRGCRQRTRTPRSKRGLSRWIEPRPLEWTASGGRPPRRVAGSDAASRAATV